MGVKSWLGKASLAVAIMGALVPLALSQTFRFSQGWPSDRSELVPDPRIRWGSLENGFRYVLLPIEGSSESVSMRFAVNVGSLREADDELGYAHLIEHLAFEGAGVFSGEEIDQLFKELGLRMGNDVNGFTTHHYTSFRLELQGGNDRGLDQALQLFRSFADGIHFEVESVEKQKAIVLAEKLKYDQPLARFGEFAFQNAMRDLLYDKRPVVGEEEGLDSATRERLMAFYKKWYRPESMTLFVVGDIAADSFKQQIERYFGTLEGRGRVAPPQLGTLLSNQVPRVQVTSIEGLERTLIDLSRTWQEPRLRDSERLRERDLLRQFATELLNERCQRFVGNFDSDFIFYDTRFETHYVHARLTSSPGKWITGVRFIDRMIRQATRYGFYPDEIDLLKSRWQKRIRNKAWIRENEGVSEIANTLENDTMSGRVYLSAADSLSLELRMLEKLDKRVLDQTQKELWRTNGVALSLGGKLPQGLNVRELSREFASYRKFNVEPYDYEKPSAVKWEFSGDSGRVLKDQFIEGFNEASRIVFDNSVQLTFLNTEHESGAIRALIRLSMAGNSIASSTNPALRSVALDSFLSSGVDGFKWEEIQRELASRLLDFSYSIEGNDSLCFRVHCDPSELVWFSRMIARYLDKGGVNERGFAFAKSNMLKGLQLELDGMTLAKRGVQRTLFPERPELWDPKLEDGFVLTLAGVQEWLHERIEFGQIEVTVVGDASKEEVVEAIGDSLGRIEYRTERLGLRVPSQRESPARGFSKLSYPGNHGSGALVIGNWILEPGPIGLRESLALVFAERILRDRVDFVLRKEMAVSYETKVDYWNLPAFAEFQRFRIEADCSPDDLELVLELIKSTFQELVGGALQYNEVERYRELLKNEHETNSKNNEYIIENVLFSVDERASWISEWNEINGGILEEITREMIVDTFNKWLPWEEAILRSVMPQS